MRNAIPREANALVALPRGGRAKAADAVARVQAAALAAEFKKTDPHLQLSPRRGAGGAPPTPSRQPSSQKVIALMLAIPSGVIAMSRDIPMLPRDLEQPRGRAHRRARSVELVRSCSRSSIKSSPSTRSAAVCAPSPRRSAPRWSSPPAYPGWQPNLDSPLLATFKAVHTEVTGKPPEVLAIHAGLECGILGERFPGMDMISFGPDPKADRAGREAEHPVDGALLQSAQGDPSVASPEVTPRMKRLLRVLKWLGVVVLVLALGVAALIFSAFHGLSSIQNGQRFDGVETVKDGIVACYLVDVGPREVALVDAGMDWSAKPILTALGRRGLGPEAVKAILLTHGDSNHIRGARAFPKAELMALAPDVALAEGREGRFLKWLFSPKPTGLKVSRALSDGQIVEVGSVSFRVYAVPGHTKGSAAFLARGVLFMGDAAESTTEGKLANGKRIASDNPALNRESLIKLASTLAPLAASVKVIAPSHSGILAKGLAPLTDFAQAR